MRGEGERERETRGLLGMRGRKDLESLYGGVFDYIIGGALVLPYSLFAPVM